MSKLYPCVHCTEDGYCKKYSDEEVKSWCVQGPCKDERPSNADCVRNMADEELAKWMVGEQINGIYAFLKGLGDDDLLHAFIEEINLHGAEEIKKEKLEWLKQEAQ